VKRFNWKKKTGPLCSCFLGTRARRGWKVANALATRRIDTPRPLGMAEKRRSGFCTESFLVTEFVEGADNLDTWLARRKQNEALTEEEKQYILEQLATLLCRVHARGFCQRDLKLSNILVRELKQNRGKLQFWLIDTDGMRQKRKLKPARRVRDLARVCAALVQGELLDESQLNGFVQLYLKGSSVTTAELGRLTERVRKRAKRLHS